MPVQKTHDLVLKIGEYTDSAGQTKARTKNVGNVMRREDGSTFLAIDASIIAMETQWVANPEHKAQVYISVYPSRDREEQAPAKRERPSAPKPAAPASDEPNDDIPF